MFLHLEYRQSLSCLCVMPHSGCLEGSLSNFVLLLPEITEADGNTVPRETKDRSGNKKKENELMLVVLNLVFVSSISRKNNFNIKPKVYEEQMKQNDGVN